MKINDDNTTQVLARMTEQSDWIWDDTSRSEKHVGFMNTGRLADETYYVDWSAIGKYGIRPHTPSDIPDTTPTSVPTQTPTPVPGHELPNTGVTSEMSAFGSAATAIIAGLGLAVPTMKKEDNPIV